MRDTLLAILHAAREGVDVEALADKLVATLPKPRRLITPGHLSLWSVCATIIMVVALCVFPHDTTLRSDGTPSLAQNMRPIAGGSVSTWYVRTDGSDSAGCGTVDAAWNGSTGGCASLSFATHAISNPPHTLGFQEQYSRAVPGDTIIMDCGTYGPQSMTTFDANFTTAWIRDTAIQTTVRASTQSGTCVTITYPANPSPTVAGTSLITASNAYDVLWDGRGVVLTGTKGRSDWNFGYAGSTAYSSADAFHLSSNSGAVDGSVVSGMTIQHVLGTCLHAEGSNQDQYLNDILTDCGTNGDALLHGLYLQGSGITVSGNTVNGSSGWCMQHYGAGDTATITNNVFENCQQGGIDLGEPTDTLSGNVMHDNAGGALAGGVNSTVQQNVSYANTRAQVAVSIGTSGHGTGGLLTTRMWNSRGIVGVNDGGTNEIWVASSAGIVRRFVASSAFTPNTDVSNAGGVATTAGADLTAGIDANVTGMVAVNANGGTANEIWIINTDNTIARYSVAGAHLGDITDAHLNGPTAAAVDGNSVYVLNKTGNGVAVFSTSGASPTYSTSWTDATNLSSPSGIAVVPDPTSGNDLWITSTGTSRLVRYTEAGSIIGSPINPTTDQTGTCAATWTPWSGGRDVAWYNSDVWVTFGSIGLLEYSNAGTYVGTYVHGIATCATHTATDLSYGQPVQDTITPIPYWNMGRLAVFGGQLWLSGGYAFNESLEPVGLFGSGDGGSVFYNNTLYNNFFTELYQSSGYSPLPVAKNNIIYGSGASDAAFLNSANQTLDYNDYYNTAAISGGGAHSITSDPAFVSTITPDFHLQAGSLAIAAGLAQASLTGYTGTALNNPPDLGAYQTVVVAALMSQAFDGYTLNATPPFSAGANDFTGGANASRLVVASDVTAHSGAQHLRVPIHAGGYVYVYKTFGGAAYTTFDATIYVRLSASWSVPSGDSMTLLRLEPVYTGPGPGDPLPKGTVSVKLTGAGVLTCHYLDGSSGADTTVTSSDTLTADGAWHKIEVRDIVANSIGSLAFTEDSTTATASSINTGTVGISAFLLGMINGTTHAALVGNLYADDLTVQST